MFTSSISILIYIQGLLGLYPRYYWIYFIFLSLYKPHVPTTLTITYLKGTCDVHTIIY